MYRLIAQGLLAIALAVVVAGGPGCVDVGGEGADDEPVVDIDLGDDDEPEYEYDD